MSEFTSSVGWRGPDHITFLLYGTWTAGAINEASSLSIAEDLARQFANARVSSFICFDEGWPCAVVVFDLEFSRLPEGVVDLCRSAIEAVCAAGAEQAWMMFDGIFNDLRDMFSADWASRVYALRADRITDGTAVAVDDDLRHSTQWKLRIAQARDHFLKSYPSAQAIHSGESG